MMMNPRSYSPPLASLQQSRDFSEKEREQWLRRRARNSASRSRSRSPIRSALSVWLAEEETTASLDLASNSIKKAESQTQLSPRRPGLSSIQPANLSPTPRAQSVPKRKLSAQDVLASTTIPIRRKPRQRPSQRLPNVDYVADFSRLLLEDLHSTNEGSVSGSWSNPQFEGLFGNIDGLVEGQMIVGSDGLDAGILSARSLSAESMPSLSSADEFSSVSPATVRSNSDQRLRHIASSEDCSNEHPLLVINDHEPLSSASTPPLTMSPPPKMRRKPMPEQKQSSFKSSLTASLRAIRSAAQTVSNIATTPPLIQPDDMLARSVFDFRPSLTDDRRPPPSDEPPSPALRRYLNPRIVVADDSPAQLHFWLDEKPTPPRPEEIENKPKIKLKRKYRAQLLEASTNEAAPLRSNTYGTSQLPSVVPLATCIPSTVRTAHASSPPTWLEPDGTPSNMVRAAQALVMDPKHGIEMSQARPREPRENRDFLRVFVCEMNMRRVGKLADNAVGRAKLWLPPVEDVKGRVKGLGKLGGSKTTVSRGERWTSRTTEGL